MKKLFNTNEALEAANAANNRYYEKFHLCKKACLRGILFGALIGAALSFLVSGFKLDETFFILFIFQGLAGVLVMSAVFGLRYTDDFGLSCIPKAIAKIGGLGYDFFEGTYVLLWVYYLIMAGVIGGWLLAVCLFSFLFPAETLYYAIRYKLESNRIRAMLNEGQLAAA